MTEVGRISCPCLYVCGAHEVTYLTRVQAVSQQAVLDLAIGEEAESFEECCRLGNCSRPFVVCKGMTAVSVHGHSKYRDPLAFFKRCHWDAAEWVRGWEVRWKHWGYHVL